CNFPPRSALLQNSRRDSRPAALGKTMSTHIRSILLCAGLAAGFGYACSDSGPTGSRTSGDTTAAAGTTGGSGGNSGTSSGGTMTGGTPTGTTSGTAGGNPAGTT